MGEEEWGNLSSDPEATWLDPLILRNCSDSPLGSKPRPPE